MKKNIGFRAWFYFRTGWATYFAFIFAAVNTLTVTYFLAIENYPFLNNIFPTFIHYVVIVALIGVPLLIAIGYVHFKKTPSFRAETDVSMETDPYRRRMVVNSEISVTLNLKLTEMLLKLLRNELYRRNPLERHGTRYDARNRRTICEGNYFSLHWF